MLFRSADPARRARILERRAARARRSTWLGRVIVSLTGVALLFALRMNPDMVEDIIARAHDVPPRAQHASFDAPQDVFVRSMPSDAVPVRRWGAETTAGIDTQARADTLSRDLTNLSPDG